MPSSLAKMRTMRLAYAKVEKLLSLFLILISSNLRTIALYTPYMRTSRIVRTLLPAQATIRLIVFDTSMALLQNVGECR